MSGGRTLDFAARQSVGTYTNLLLLHRDRLIKDFSPEVPAEVVSAMRYAELPSGSHAFSPEATSSATDKKRTASQDALITQALTSRIPRSSGNKKSKSKRGGHSGPPAGTGSPVVPKAGSEGSSAPSTSSGRGGKKKKKGKKSSGGRSFRGGSSRGGASGKGQGEA